MIAEVKKNTDRLDRSMPTVSIIVPAYKTARYITEALESVFAQTRTDYEVIVINDGSPDTAELERVLEPYRDRILYMKQENRGLAGARNTGIRQSRAPFIALLDSDDLWFPNYLAVQLRMLEQDPSIDVLYADAEVFGDAPEAGRTFMDLTPSMGDVTFEKIVRGQCTVMVSVTMRREAVVTAGMFDESLRGAEDFDLWLRILNRGGRIAYHRGLLIRYRRRGGCLMADMVGMAKEQLRVLEKAEQMNHLTATSLAVVRGQHERVRALLSFHVGKRAFLEGDVQAAINNLTDANRLLKSLRMALVIILLRLIPRLLLKAYQLRHRYIYKASTTF